jgi:hypothetical protein
LIIGSYIKITDRNKNKKDEEETIQEIHTQGRQPSVLIEYKQFRMFWKRVNSFTSARFKLWIVQPAAYSLDLSSKTLS